MQAHKGQVAHALYPQGAMQGYVCADSQSPPSHSGQTLQKGAATVLYSFQYPCSLSPVILLAV